MITLIARNNFAVMHIFYEENFFRSNSKEELIGFTEFLCKTKMIMNSEL